MHLIIFTLTGQSCSLSANPEDTVDDVLQQVDAIVGKTVADILVLNSMLVDVKNGGLRLVSETTGLSLQGEEQVGRFLENPAQTGLEAGSLEVKIVLRKTILHLSTLDSHVLRTLLNQVDDEIERINFMREVLMLLLADSAAFCPCATVDHFHMKFNVIPVWNTAELRRGNLANTGVAYEGYR